MQYIIEHQKCTATIIVSKEKVSLERDNNAAVDHNDLMKICALKKFQTTDLYIPLIITVL